MTETARPDLLAEVSAALAEQQGGTVVGANRSEYSTSHMVFDVNVDVAGCRRTFVLKDLSPAGLVPEARGRRPPIVDDPSREVAVYRSVLAGRNLGTARCIASGRQWLLLEKVAGVELYQVGEVATWAHAAARMAELHRTLAPVACDPPPPLAHFDARYYELWWDRAAAFSACWERDRRRALGWLSDRRAAVVEAVAGLPTTVAHGDCSPSNVLVDPTTGRVCPVDWEMAGVGPGLLDLAALRAGWSERQSARIAGAYHSALGPDRPSAEAFRTALDLCCIQLHVQWLGWSAGWVPPIEHRQDCLAEAVRLAERLGL